MADIIDCRTNLESEMKEDSRKDSRKPAVGRVFVVVGMVVGRF